MRADFPKLNDIGVVHRMSDSEIDIMMNQFAVDNDLMTDDFLVEFKRENGLRIATFKVWKNIKGKRGTYELKTCISESSVMFLFTGAPADVYPTPAIASFIRSLRLQGRGSQK